MMNRDDINNELLAKSILSNKQIRHFVWDLHRHQVLSDSSTTSWDKRLCHDTQIEHWMTEAARSSIWNHSSRLRRESHLLNVDLWEQSLIAYRQSSERARNVSNKSSMMLLSHSRKDKQLNRSNQSNQSRSWSRERLSSKALWSSSFLLAFAFSIHSIVISSCNLASFSSILLSSWCSTAWKTSSSNRTTSKSSSQSSTKTISTSSNESRQWRKKTTLLINDTWDLQTSLKNRKILRDK